MQDNFEDIINLPHHISKRHRPMAPEMRAAQFAPFAALAGHNEALTETARQSEQLFDINPTEPDEQFLFTDF